MMHFDHVKIFILARNQISPTFGRGIGRGANEIGFQTTIGALMEMWEEIEQFLKMSV